MKKIYWILLALIGAGMSFTACNEEEPFSTATADDEPRIIAPTFPELDNNGNMKTFMELDRDKLLSITVTTTPADYTSVVWYLDGIEVGTEKTLEMNLNTGIYNLKVVVSTPSGKSTSRETLIKIKPLGEDPQSEEKVSERLVSAGGYATISGTNLDKVKKITLQRINVAESKSDSESFVIEIPESDITSSSTSVSFSLPGNIAAGTYRVTLIDAEGNEFGANTIEVTQMTLVKSGLDDNRKPGSSWTYTGINMDQIVSLIIGDFVIDSFEKQNSSSLTFTSPSVSDGEYTISGKTKSGENVKFYVGETMVESTMVTIDGAANVISFAKLLRSGNDCKFEGKNISLIKSIFINNNEVSINSQTDESLTFTCPPLTGGKYSMHALCQDGRKVKFKTDNGFVEETSVLISSGTELFDGHYYLSWSLPDDNPNKTLKIIEESNFGILQTNYKIKIYFSINLADEYHQVTVRTAAEWKEIPGCGVLEIKKNEPHEGIYEMTLTDDMINQIKTESGLIVVGHGYYVDRVTYEQ
ncbi:hypothetical protein H6A66_13070 [Bacteroides caecigallinarum]|uniref:hypothetical protein n=1 Tax=Bacteroides caecigallinarum TaxID=1411144 RepID=UPI001957E26F|nr:hypothetical protein [Bacteroides caecigallinarum]MBM6866092.1 hypothetical protein [Bacteroides caecigallinarum]